MYITKRLNTEKAEYTYLVSLHKESHPLESIPFSITEDAVDDGNVKVQFSLFPPDSIGPLQIQNFGDELKIHREECQVVEALLEKFMAIINVYREPNLEWAFEIKQEDLEPYCENTQPW